MEITGSASFMKMFQMPVTPTYRATSVPVNPHERRIEYVRPIAIAPPAGQRVRDRGGRLRRAPPTGPSCRPGSAAMFANQYVNRLKTVAATRVPSSIGVSVVIAVQTSP